MVGAIFLTIIFGIIGVTLFFQAGYRSCGCNQKTTGKKLFGIFLFGILFVALSISGIIFFTYVNCLGYPAPANSLQLERNSVYQLVWQGDIGDKHMAALVKRDSVLELVESDGEVRFYELEQPLPQGVAYFKAVKEEDETTLVPLPIELLKKSEEQ